MMNDFCEAFVVLLVNHKCKCLTENSPKQKHYCQHEKDNTDNFDSISSRISFW